LNVDVFFDFDYKIQVVKRSSYENNQLLDRAEIMEFANWRINLAAQAPFNIQALIKKVEETYDIDAEEFEQTKQDNNGGIDPRAMAMAQMQKGGGGGMPQPAAAMAPGKQLDLGSMMGQ
jgi:chromosomal replication initiation ATPase DnaA